MVKEPCREETTLVCASAPKEVKEWALLPRVFRVATRAFARNRVPERNAESLMQPTISRVRDD